MRRCPPKVHMNLHQGGDNPGFPAVKRGALRVDPFYGLSLDCFLQSMRFGGKTNQTPANGESPQFGADGKLQTKRGNGFTTGVACMQQ